MQNGMRIQAQPAHSGILNVTDRVYKVGACCALWGHRHVNAILCVTNTSYYDVNNSSYSSGYKNVTPGQGPTLIGILHYAGLKFHIYEELKRHIPKEHQKSILMRCGALAGLVGQTFTYPLDVVWRQMMIVPSVAIGFTVYDMMKDLASSTS
ncbi:unnamed protein product [Fraxinus pennsylvanica]|uniref:Uncharacterized protein n=1 Tax=Fraxinus pennsylvanica TaxID=56036 RepID=A0AAD1ZX62_9LAMI|nr:unnamed protein product [Fraxinus pennsylvanica]